MLREPQGERKAVAEPVLDKSVITVRIGSMATDSDWVYGYRFVLSLRLPVRIKPKTNFRVELVEK